MYNDVPRETELVSNPHVTSESSCSVLRHVLIRTERSKYRYGCGHLSEESPLQGSEAPHSPDPGAGATMSTVRDAAASVLPEPPI